VLTGLLDDEANTTKGRTSATVIATLATIRVLKEKRRRRFVVVAGVEPRRDAYRGIVHDDEKINAVVAIGHGKKTHCYRDAGKDSTDSLPKYTGPFPMKPRRRSF